MIPSFSSTCRAIGKVLNFQEGTSLANSEDLETQALGRAMLHVRRDLVLYSMATVAAIPIYFSSNCRGGCAAMVASVLFSGENVSRESFNKCTNAITCVIPMTLFVFSISLIESIREACYTHYRNSVELPREELNAQTPLKKILLNVAILGSNSLPSPIEYFGGTQIELRKPITVTAALTYALFCFVFLAGVAWISYNYLTEHSSLPNCLPASFALGSLVLLSSTLVDLFDTASRAEKFFQRQRAQ